MTDLVTHKMSVKWRLRRSHPAYCNGRSCHPTTLQLLRRFRWSCKETTVRKLKLLRYVYESTGVHYSSRHAVKITLASLAWYIWPCFFLLYKRQKQLPLENTLTIQCVAQVSLSNDNVSCILSRKDTIKSCKTAFTKHYLSNSQLRKNTLIVYQLT